MSDEGLKFKKRRFKDLAWWSTVKQREESDFTHLGAVHELSCQAYILHTAGAQQGLNKDLQQTERREGIIQEII